MKNLLVLLILLLCVSCDINNQKLMLINNSAEPIYYMLLTDTVLNDESFLYEALPQDTVWPNFVRGGEGAWEYKINSHSKDSTLYVFIFNKNLINDSIIKCRFFKRIGYNIKELDSLKWTIEYK